MKDGFIKVAAVTPKVKVADVDYNCQEICQWIDTASAEGIKVMVFPELCITGYTCQDLFLQDRLLEEAVEGLGTICTHTKEVDGLIFVGLPFAIKGKLYNVAAAINHGNVVGIVPKTFLPNYNEFYEARHFHSGKDLNMYIRINGDEVPVTTNHIFTCDAMPSLRIAVELCEDLWVPNPPSISHALAGANLIVNLSASNQIIGKGRYRRELVSGQSARLVCGYIYACAGPSESTQDVVYSGHNIIAENGKLLGDSKIFRLAHIAFANQYDDETILKWEKTFYRRFFAQHFKRSCLPDGPKVGSVAVSPRGDLRMPSDACGNIWLKELEAL